jgi:hypothetical protein
MDGLLGIEPSGHYAYLAGTPANATNNQVYQFSIGASGTLSPLSPATIDTSPFSLVTIAPSGNAIYLSSAGQFARYTIGAGGNLTASVISNNGVASSLSKQLIIDDSASNAYELVTVSVGALEAETGIVYQYRIDATGALLPQSPASFQIASGAEPIAQGILGPNFYVLSALAGEPTPALDTHQPGHVDHYSISSDGELIDQDTVAVPGLVSAFTLVTHP